MQTCCEEGIAVTEYVKRPKGDGSGGNRGVWKGEWKKSRGHLSLSQGLFCEAKMNYKLIHGKETYQSMEIKGKPGKV